MPIRGMDCKSNNKGRKIIKVSQSMYYRKRAQCAGWNDTMPTKNKCSLGSRPDTQNAITG